MCYNVTILYQKGVSIMNGKSKCKILKDIRRQIAQDNDIEFVTSECKYQGDCCGTCPKCEAEVRYLEQELAKRQKAGKAIAVAGIAATLVVGASGCGIGISSIAGDVPAPPEITQTDPTSDTTPSATPPDHSTDPSNTVTAGDPMPGDYTEPLTGDPVYEYVTSGMIVAP